MELTQAPILVLGCVQFPLFPLPPRSFWQSGVRANLEQSIPVNLNVGTGASFAVASAECSSATNSGSHSSALKTSNSATKCQTHSVA